MKNLNLINVGYLVFILILCSSCEEELNIAPTDAITPEIALSTEENVLNLLTGAYAETANSNFLGGNSQVTSDLLGSAYNEVSYNGLARSPLQIFLKNILPNNFFVTVHFGTAYQVINQTNLVLDNLAVITSSDDRRLIAEGEAKFLRALAYFDLVRLWALPYEFSGANTQLGVPLQLSGILDFNEDLSIARSSVDDIYDQIITDLNEAIVLLPADNNEFADKYAAMAILARVHLMRGEYEEALVAANNVLQNSGHVLASSYSAAFNNDSDSPEDIFAFQYTNQDVTTFLIDIYASQNFGGSGGDISIEEGYLNLFDDPINDERANFFYISPNNGLLLTSKYTNIHGNISNIRVAEMHLIRAECNFRLSTFVGLDPLTDINLLRARSNASPFTSLTLELILNERRLELAFEGHLIHDIKRTQGSVEGFNYNADNLVLPIPLDEMESNPLMEQNPGY